MTMKTPENFWPLKHARREALVRVFKERGRAFAFVPVCTEDAIGSTFGLGVAEFGVGGYSPISTGWARFKTYDEAAAAADQINSDRLRLSIEDAARIVADTMKRPAGMGR